MEGCIFWATSVLVVVWDSALRTSKANLTMMTRRSTKRGVANDLVRVSDSKTAMTGYLWFSGPIAGESPQLAHRPPLHHHHPFQPSRSRQLFRKEQRRSRGNKPLSLYNGSCCPSERCRKASRIAQPAFAAKLSLPSTHTRDISAQSPSSPLSTLVTWASTSTPISHHGRSKSARGELVVLRLLLGERWANVSNSEFPTINNERPRHKISYILYQEESTIGVLDALETSTQNT